MRPAQLAEILDYEFVAASAGQHTPVMLWGPPGVGKSQIVAQIAARHAVQVIDVRLSQMEPSDLRGIPFRVEQHGKSAVEWAAPSLLPDALRHGDRGVLFLDEITSAPPSVSAAAYQLILDQAVDQQYAVAAALASRALRARGSPEAALVWGRILDYAGRLPLREMGVMLVADLHRGIGPELFALPQFSAWAGAVADLLLYE